MSIFAIDFDGTCVTHEYPAIGRNIGAVPVLKALVENGHQLILYTVRSGEHLEQAKDWFEENDLPLYGVQTNPQQSEWTQSPKCYAHRYIDDAAVGCPLIYVKTPGQRPYVDWSKVLELLKMEGFVQ